MKPFKTYEFLQILWRLSYIVSISAIIQFAIPSLPPVSGTSNIIALDNSYVPVAGTGLVCSNPGFCYTGICRLLNLNYTNILERYNRPPTWCHDSLPTSMDAGVYMTISSFTFYSLFLLLQIIAAYTDKPNYQNLYEELNGKNIRPSGLITLNFMLSCTSILANSIYCCILKRYNPLALPICVVNIIQAMFMLIDISRNHNPFVS